MTTSELRRRRWRCDRGLLGLVLVCVLEIFFFFFLINTSVFGLLENLCVWFAGVCFAFVLGFDLFVSDDAT